MTRIAHDKWIMNTKRVGVCAETGKAIYVGHQVLYMPAIPFDRGPKVYSIESNFFKINVENYFAIYA